MGNARLIDNNILLYLCGKWSRKLASDATSAGREHVVCIRSCLKRISAFHSLPIEISHYCFCFFFSLPFVAGGVDWHEPLLISFGLISGLIWCVSIDRQCP